MNYNEISTQNITKKSEDIVSSITNLLTIPRNALPSNDDINYVLQLLPRELKKVPKRLINQSTVKACVAASVGLFDSAIIYIWNNVIDELRKKVQAFGYEMIKYISSSTNISKSKDDGKFLKEMKDKDLLELCYQLNIINDEGYFYLDKCRETRNQASVAHPTVINIDETETINFISKCCKYGLSDKQETEGINMKDFISSIQNQNADIELFKELAEKISKTFDSQKELIVKILFSKFVDSSESSHVRNNSLQLSLLLKKSITDKMITDLVKKYTKIKFTNKKEDAANSRKYFEKMGLLNYLESSEQITIFKKAIDNLLSTHNDINNFYNEPPFAEHLYEVSLQISPIPNIIIDQYIDICLQCFIGNDYGYSWQASSYCENMLENLTPKGINNLLNKLTQSSYINEINSKPWKKEQIAKLYNYYTKSSIVNDEQKNLLLTLNKKYSIA